MPAIITHHIFGEDVLRTLPAGMVEGEEEVLAFLLGNQGPDPLFARFSTAPSVAVRCRRLGHAMHDGRVVEAAFAMRDGVSHLPVADERVGRAFALGALGHYALDRTAHPFVFAQQEALAAAEASLAGAGSSQTRPGAGPGSAPTDAPPGPESAAPGMAPRARTGMSPRSGMARAPALRQPRRRRPWRRRWRRPQGSCRCGRRRQRRRRPCPRASPPPRGGSSGRP